jgi:Flp pilus assembly protein TadG
MTLERKILRTTIAARRRSAEIVGAVRRCWDGQGAWAGRSKALTRNEQGGSMIEFVLSFSALMIFVFAIMEMCMLFYSYGMISESARDATRYAIVRGSTCLTSSSTSCTASAATINSYAKGLGLPNIGGGTLSVNTTFPDGNENPGSRVKVDVQYSVSIKLPFMPHNAIPLDSSSEMYILQ